MSLQNQTNLEMEVNPEDEDVLLASDGEGLDPEEANLLRAFKKAFPARSQPPEEAATSSEVATPATSTDVPMLPLYHEQGTQTDSPLEQPPCAAVDAPARSIPALMDLEIARPEVLKEILPAKRKTRRGGRRHRRPGGIASGTGQPEEKPAERKVKRRTPKGSKAKNKAKPKLALTAQNPKGRSGAKAHSPSPGPIAVAPIVEAVLAQLGYTCTHRPNPVECRCPSCPSAKLSGPSKRPKPRPKKKKKKAPTKDTGRSQ